MKTLRAARTRHDHPATTMPSPAVQRTHDSTIPAKRVDQIRMFAMSIEALPTQQADCRRTLITSVIVSALLRGGVLQRSVLPTTIQLQHEPRDLVDSTYVLCERYFSGAVRFEIAGKDRTRNIAEHGHPPRRRLLTVPHLLRRTTHISKLASAPAGFVPISARLQPMPWARKTQYGAVATTFSQTRQHHSLG